MLNTIFATKVGMSQAWSEEGKRLPITKLQVAPNVVLSKKLTQDQVHTIEVGYGQKKLKNVQKPLREQIKKSGFSFGSRQIKGVKLADEGVEAIAVGQTVDLGSVLAVGDVVSVQGTSKGRGFAGAVKRHGFHGGPKTHGQSDRHRAVGSIGAGTTPGRVWKGKRMPGHYGVETKTVSGLVVVHLDPQTQEIWLNGPVPGFRSSTVRITKTGNNKDLKLNLSLLGLDQVAEVEAAAAPTDAAEVAAAPAESQA